jgi:hypothetical protein
MTRATRSARIKRYILGVATAAAMALPALAQKEGGQDKDDSRGVRIIDAPTPGPVGTDAASTPQAPPAGAARPALLPPLTEPSAPMATTAPGVPPRPTVVEGARPEPRPIPPSSAGPVLVPPLPAPESSPATSPGGPLAPSTSATLTPPAPTLVPPSAVPAPNIATPSVSTPTPGGVAALPPGPTSLAIPPTTAELEARSKSIKVANPAELAVEILPGPDIAPGSKVSFQITTRKAGYLVLVDIDATGKLTQIYPNPMSLMAAKGPRENTNLIRPGKPIQLPNPRDVLSGFEFVASPPFGTAMIVALLSDRPVQMIDLPDIPSMLLGSASAAEHLSKLANELRIPDPKGSGAFLEAHWSFDAKFYAIRYP